MMDWFNIYGLAIIAIMMIPNAVYAAKCPDGFENLRENRIIYPLEQVGRFGCFGLMAINIPGTWSGFWFDGALTVYIAVNAVLLLIYCGIWVVCFRDNGVSTALALSVIPSVIFLFSGAMIVSIPLIVAAAIFAPCHIVISYKNAALAST